jgi:hypothetical protein
LNLNRNTKEDPMEDTYREIMAIAGRRARTEVAEYDGKLYVRAGRRVVAVYDPQSFTVEARKPRSREEVNVLNDVLDATDIDGFHAVGQDVIDADTGEKIDECFFWETLPKGGEYDDSPRDRTPFEPRTEISILTTGFLAEDGPARDAHNLAIEAYWEVPNAE